MHDGTQPLTVRSVGREARDIVSLELVHPEGRRLPAWSPGAHIDIRLPSGLVRSYSLCGDQADPRVYRVAVLRADPGRGGSAEIHENALVGHQFSVSPPRNNFPLRPAPHYLFLAGGIGITPILAMARAASASGTAWTLVYGGRSRSSMAFVDSLETLPGGDLVLVPQDECGLPDLAAAFARSPAGAVGYCCGPAVMIDAVLAAGRAVRPEMPILLERFSADTSGAGLDERKDEPFEVTLSRTGTTVTVPRGVSVLEAVRMVRPDVMSSCEEGICSACETPVLEGIPDHRDGVLTPRERAANRYMMICVSRSLTPRLVLDL
jgi:ferredoxin-NADP reductase